MGIKTKFKRVFGVAKIKSLLQQRSKFISSLLNELLIVIAIIAVLASVVIVAINPARQFAQANNSQRWSNVNTILNAIHQYAIDNKGTLPTNISTSVEEICVGDTATTTCTGASLTPLNELIWGETYIVSIPTDPQCDTVCATNGVGYTVTKSVNGRVTVAAPDAQLGETIEVTR